jgi:hypothetical protein
MPIYTRKNMPSGHPNDYVFCCNGAAVGRCYLRPFADADRQWSWSIYIGIHVKRLVQGVPVYGYATTFEIAEKNFREAFERMIEANVVVLPTI